MTMTKAIRSQYDGSRVPVLMECSGKAGKSRTKQQFAHEADVNNIMARYRRTGLLVDPAAVNQSRVARYGDFSGGVDFQAAQNKIALVRNAFGELPSDIRRLFDNDPAQLLDYISDPANADEAAELGLLTAAEAAELKGPAPALEAPPAPSEGSESEPVAPIESPPTE